MIKWGWNICAASTFCRCGQDTTVRSKRVAWCTVWLNAWYFWQKVSLPSVFTGARLRRAASVHLG